MQKTKTIIVVGGNAAGPGAAAKAKRTDPSAKVILFEAGDFISTGTCEMPYVLSGEISSYNKIIFFDPQSFYNSKGVETFVNSSVVEINTAYNKVIVKNNKNSSASTFEYDKLILAVGSIPKRSASIIPNGKNIFYFKSIGDLIKLQSFIQNYPNRKRAAVFGAGLIGLELCESFTKLGFEVYLIERENLPLPFAEPEIGAIASKIIVDKGIKFYKGVKNVSIRETDANYLEIEFENIKFTVDLIVSSIGFAPNSQLAAQTKLELGQYGGIRTDNKLRASNCNIYAAGDCAETVDFITNRYSYLPFASIAHRSGHIAGENAAGGNAKSKPIVKNIASKFFEYIYSNAGLTSIEAEKFGLRYKTVSAAADNLVKVMPDSRTTFAKIIYEKESGKIIGGSFLGGKESAFLSDMISVFIKNKNKISDLSEFDYNYTPAATPFINILSIIGRKSKNTD